MAKPDEIAFELPPVDMLPSAEHERCYDFTESPFRNHPGFTKIGDMPYLESRQIRSSPVGIGYETLDRSTFDPEFTYRYMAASGVKWARLQSGWNRTERVCGVYDFGWLDKIVDNLLAIGIQPWISVSFGNRLYTPVAEYEEYIREHAGEPIPPHIEQYVGEVPLYHGAEAVRGWENYLIALATHYRGRVRHWEIWNEPNAGGMEGGGFWRVRNRPQYRELTSRQRSAQFAADYAELVRISAAALKKNGEPAVIIAGAITNGHEPCDYIMSLAKSSIAENADIISYHPYGLTPEMGVEPRCNFIRNNIVKNGRPIEVWQGEAGRTAGTPREEYSVIATEYNQAKYLLRRYFTDIRLGCGVSSYFMVCDMGGGYLPDGDYEFGVLNRKKQQPRLAYYALQAAGYLFAEVTQAPDLYIRYLKPDFRICSSNQRYQLVTGQFRRAGVPLFGIYSPETPDLATETVQVDLRLYTQEDDHFTEPVVIDPLRRQVFRINDLSRPDDREGGISGIWRVSHFPVTDYPLFITDISALQNPGSRA